MKLFFKTGIRPVLAGVATLFLSASLLAAEAEKVKAHDPDPAANPVLAGIMKTGAKLYFLGDRGGLDGWLIYKDGQVQVAYALPDSKYALVGGLFGPDGDSVSSEQIQTLLTNNKELNAQLAMGMQTTTAPTVPGQVPASMPQQGNQAVDLPSPGERLMKDLQNAAGVDVGDSSAPMLMMVMDPNCPHCQATWRTLHDSVANKKLQIRLVPIGVLGTDNGRAAAQLLHVADPITAWDKYIAGDKTQLAGTPDPALTAAVHANEALIDSWHIEMTPYLVYRAKDGKVKIVQGEPESAAIVLNDIK